MNSQEIIDYIKSLKICAFLFIIGVIKDLTFDEKMDKLKNYDTRR
jgi:hypothetical protein